MRGYAGVAVIVVAGMLSGAASPAHGVTVRPADSPAAWKVLPSPSRPGWNSLESVSASPAGDAWAVGWVETGKEAVASPLAEHWDGHRWRLAAMPDGPYRYSNELNSVSAYSADDAWAVGLSEGPPVGTQGVVPLAEHWDGHNWVSVATAHLTRVAKFNSVTDLGPEDAWAVGQYEGAAGGTLIEHFDGRGWHVVPSPNPGIDTNALWQVAASGPDDVWAMGEYSYGLLPVLTLAEHWDGHRWRVVPTPDDLSAQFNFVESLAAYSPGCAWAAVLTSGNTYGHFFIRWNGKKWQTLAGLGNLTGDIGLGGITIVSAAQVWLAGAYGGTMVGHWNGSRWQRVATPNPGTTANALNAITFVPTTRQFLAVGYREGNGLASTLILAGQAG